MGPVIGKADTTMRILTLLFVAATLTACASPEVWRKSGANQDEVSADTAVCQNAARHVGEGTNFVYAHVTSYNYFNNCMASRGYLVSMF